MSDFDRFLAKIISFDPALNVSQQDQQRFIYCIKLIMHRYQQQLGNTDLFSKLQSLRVTQGSNPVLAQCNCIGLDTYDHRIYVTFFDYPGFDSSIDGHELAHEAFSYLLGSAPQDPDWNNLVHYAYNSGIPYLTYQDIVYHNWLQFLKLNRTKYQYRISYANLALLLENRDRIRNEIKTGIAPQNPNKYWPYPV